jgi:hypothetical protein
MSVSTALFRIYRPVVLWFAALVVLAELIGVTAIVSVTGDIRFSFWLAIVGSAAKYWTLVVGIMLIGMNMRQFLTNGVTRREFIAGAAVVILVLAAGFTAVVVLGHGLESVLLGAIGQRGENYPVFTAGDLLRETGHTIPQALAWPLSGTLIAIGFLRFRIWLGLVVAVLGSVPAALANGLLGLNEAAVSPDLLPYPVALLLWLVAIVLGAVALRLMTRDVPIRPKAA